ncbi:MAG TPA: hypothetical protein VFO06_01940 [Gemmatimonadales bacterium]|nr:hypothetical protein [Gemmatimonadales bacterium]
MADFGDIIFWGLVALYVLKLLTGNKPKIERAPPVERPPVRRPSERVAAGRLAGTQQEGTLLEQFLRQLEEAQAGPAGAGEGGPLGRRSRTRLEGAEEVEETESLEAEEQVANLETAPIPSRRRVEVDQDDAAEALVQRRIDAAEARNQGLTARDHGAFDARIRAEVADRTAVAAVNLANLRHAFIWSEILGKPVSER